MGKRNKKEVRVSRYCEEGDDEEKRQNEGGQPGDDGKRGRRWKDKEVEDMKMKEKDG